MKIGKIANTKLKMKYNFSISHDNLFLLWSEIGQSHFLYCFKRILNVKGWIQASLKSYTYYVSWFDLMWKSKKLPIMSIFPPKKIRQIIGGNTGKIYESSPDSWFKIGNLHLARLFLLPTVPVPFRTGTIRVVENVKCPEWNTVIRCCWHPNRYGLQCHPLKGSHPQGPRPPPIRHPWAHPYDRLRSSCRQHRQGYNNKDRQYDGDTKVTGLSSEGQSIKGRFEE